MLSAADYETLARDFSLESVPNGPPILNGGLLVRYVPEGQSPQYYNYGGSARSLTGSEFQSHCLSTTGRVTV